MNKPSKTINNPMTLIAIFATLSETSAAISLPFLDDQDRECYVWFLISFPFYLLLLFFITLNFNHRALYSPSDFRKNKHFLRNMNSRTCRRKRILRPANKFKVFLLKPRRCRDKTQRAACAVCSQCRICRPKRTRPVKGHAAIITLYILYHSTNVTAPECDN